MNLFARLRFSEVVLLTFVIAIAAMLIVPLPTPMLDLLLVLNIAFSILLLLVGLYVANSAALYTTGQSCQLLQDGTDTCFLAASAEL